jgi:hypothetical protein
MVKKYKSRRIKSYIRKSLKKRGGGGNGSLNRAHNKRIKEMKEEWESVVRHRAPNELIIDVGLEWIMLSRPNVNDPKILNSSLRIPWHDRLPPGPGAYGTPSADIALFKSLHRNIYVPLTEAEIAVFTYIKEQNDPELVKLLEKKTAHNWWIYSLYIYKNEEDEREEYFRQRSLEIEEEKRKQNEENKQKKEGMKEEVIRNIEMRYEELNRQLDNLGKRFQLGNFTDTLYYRGNGLFRELFDELSKPYYNALVEKIEKIKSE